MKEKTLFRIIILLSVLGIVASAYLLSIHKTNGATDSFCDIDNSFSCTLVDQSEYSEFLGIPMSMLGVIGYFILIILSFLICHKKKLVNIIPLGKLWKLISFKMILFVATLALIISLYLTYLELFIIKSICLLCLFSQVLILIIAILSYLNMRIKRNNVVEEE